MITPNEQYTELAKSIGYDDLYFKREDLHPYGSHKGRSIPVMIDHYYKNGVRKFAISSSGNAALAAALHIKKINGINTDKASLEIFVGNNVNETKLAKIKTLIDSESTKYIKLSKVERPLQSLLEATKNGAQSLRQSDDDIALIGYEELAKEIAEIPNIGAIFIGTSSGTTAQALAKYFDSKVQIYIVQTSSCHPMSDEFSKCEIINETSVADAIVDKIALRRSALISLIRKTGGYGWCASNQDIENAIDITKKNTGILISNNSALSVAGAMLAKKAGYKINGTVVCMICGI
jgi:threonine synthase